MQVAHTRIVRVCVYCLCTMTLLACSFKSLYNHLDIFIAEYISDMVSLDDVLSHRVDMESIAFHDWHRKTQLEEYATWFDALQADVRPDITEATVVAHLDRLETFWNTLLDRTFNESAGLIALLDEHQQKELFENIETKNSAFYQKYVDLTDDERVDQFIDRIEDSLEPWLDDLTDKQEKLIAQLAATLKPFAAERFRERQRWQRELLPIVKAKIPAEIKTVQLQTYFRQFAQNKNAVIDSRKAYNTQQIAHFMVQLMKSMDAEQTRYLKSRLAEYAKIFRELAADTDQEPDAKTSETNY